MDRCRFQPRLNQGQQATFIQAASHLVEDVVSIEKAQHQCFHPTAVGQHMSWVGGDERINKRGHLEFA